MSLVLMKFKLLASHSGSGSQRKHLLTHVARPVHLATVKNNKFPLNFQSSCNSGSGFYLIALWDALRSLVQKHWVIQTYFT